MWVWDYGSGKYFKWKIATECVSLNGLNKSGTKLKKALHLIFLYIVATSMPHRKYAANPCDAVLS